MVAYNYKKQFAGAVESQSKKHTIRQNGKRLHAKPGQMIQHYVGMRTKSCEKIIDDTECVGSFPIEIYINENTGKCHAIHIKDFLLPSEHYERFAREDGFRNLDDFVFFFGPGLFEGTLICWDASSIAMEFATGESN